MTECGIMRLVATHTDDAALLELVGELGALMDLEEMRPTLLSALHRAVPAHWISLNELGPTGIVTLVDPPLEDRWHELWAAHAGENPLYQRWQRTHDGRAYRFSDVTTRQELESTRLYAELYGPLGLRHQIAFTLPSEPDRILALVLSRTDDDFSDAERDFLDRARPYLIQVYRNAIAYSETRRPSPAELEAALAAQGLTPREARVMQLVALGTPSDEVAVQLGVSDRTVHKHLEHAFAKLGVSNRAAATARAWQLPVA